MSILAPLRGKSVFVTGHTGFKGSWLCLWLSELGAKLTGYSLDPPSEPNNFTASGIKQVVQTHHHGDIRDPETLTTAMKDAQPDLVLHLAAQSVVRESYKHPRETFDINVMGTIGVLESVRTLGRPCSVICVTSDKCYENVEQVWGYRECDAMGEHDPYGGSKGAAELAIRSYRHSFFPPGDLARHGVKLASCRAGNVIGGGDWKKDALIVDVVRALAGNEPVALRSPDAFRPWQHVLQALSGYLALASKLLSSDDPRFCSAWNFGPVPGNELPVRDVVEIFQKAWGRSGWVDASDPNNPPEANILRLSIDKALWELGWCPCWDVHEVLRQTAEWYQRYTGEGGPMHDFTLNQIRAYQQDFERGVAQHDLSSSPAVGICKDGSSQPGGAGMIAQGG